MTNVLAAKELLCNAPQEVIWELLKSQTFLISVQYILLYAGTSVENVLNLCKTKNLCSLYIDVDHVKMNKKCVICGESEYVGSDPGPF